MTFRFDVRSHDSAISPVDPSDRRCKWTRDRRFSRETRRVNSSISLLIDFSSSIPLFLPCSLSYSPSPPPLSSLSYLSLSLPILVSDRLCLFDIPALGRKLASPCFTILRKTRIDRIRIPSPSLCLTVLSSYSFSALYVHLEPRCSTVRQRTCFDLATRSLSPERSTLEDCGHDRRLSIHSGSHSAFHVTCRRVVT